MSEEREYTRDELYAMAVGHPADPAILSAPTPASRLSNLASRMSACPFFVRTRDLNRIGAKPGEEPDNPVNTAVEAGVKLSF